MPPKTKGKIVLYIINGRPKTGLFNFAKVQGKRSAKNIGAVKANMKELNERILSKLTLKPCPTEPFYIFSGERRSNFETKLKQP